jgi:uncharacterized membrane protein YphA (DoxX/SURF4 family)
MTSHVHRPSRAVSEAAIRPVPHSPSLQAFWILRIGFTVAPILAGLDKFFHLLTNWDQYLAPVVDRMLGGYGHEFMLVVGVIEVIAGVGVAIVPRIFAWIVAAWLCGIIVNLLMAGDYYDIALRDLGLVFGAVALARLSASHTAKRPA